MVMEFHVDPDKSFQKAMSDAIRGIQDLTIPFILITKEWFQGNKSIFAIAGKGKYADLSSDYKKYKTRKYGSPYPILKASGRLEASITDPTSADSMAVILNKTSLTLGSRIPYGPYLQFGTNRMPARPFILLGVEQVSTGAINKRQENWLKLVTDYVDQVTKPLRS